ncbi:hypothetical protein [Marininema halotolerans]|uniref:Spore germination protein gerPA/gerPF n=1 Tax=Marininema halotolerans TaxID=1155944 RepID=A0A1I6Q3J4_9BACL|nr:hypothetical protein [Marininema halotolerans]SFS46918.1 hypothetical protein SAMN05444972_102307 [Marininema halotolerans]
MSIPNYSINNSTVYNNITNFKINSITGGMVSLGNGINVGAASSANGVGGSTVVGDGSRNIDYELNRNNTQGPSGFED